MKQKLFLITILLCIMFPLYANAFIIEYDGEEREYTGLNCTLNVDGKTIPTPDMPPIIINDRTLVPLRELCEALGAVVSYDSKNIMIDREGDIIEMTIDKSKVYFNGKAMTIPDGVTPKLINFPGMWAKTMVPARFIAETLGKTVDFDSTTNTVLIYTAPQSTPKPAQTPTPTKTPVATQTPKPTKTPAPTAKPVSSAVLTKATYSQSTSSGNTTLTLTLTTDVNYEGSVSSFTLDNPYRTVFDIPNASMGSGLKNITLSSSPFSGIRFGYDGSRTRVVIDSSAKAVSYKASKSGKTITITATAKNTSTVSPTPVPTQTPKPTTTPSTTAPTTKNNAKKYIVIDPGHGGADPGAVSTVLKEQLNEKDLTLSIAKKVSNILATRGYNVVMTREGDTLPSLSKRAEIANDCGAALFVSIHMNSSPSESPSGTETYYSQINNDDDFGTTSAVLAKNIQTLLQKALNSVDRGVKTANHAVTKRSLMPAVLIEVGFISNTKEAGLLSTEEYQNKAANAIAEGIIQTWKDVVMPTNWDELAAKRNEALK